MGVGSREMDYEWREGGRLYQVSYRSYRFNSPVSELITGGEDREEEKGEESREMD